MPIGFRTSATILATAVAVSLVAAPERRQAGWQLLPRSQGDVSAAQPVSHTFVGAVEFGAATLRHALRLRGFSGDRVTVERFPGAAESWSISSDRITGADDRGLMYGLLEAAHQIETSGRLTAASGRPATPIRGIRTFIHNRDLEARWYDSIDYWNAYFSLLASDRFNRFNLVFAHQTNYMAPPYAFWVSLPAFPQIRALGVSDAQQAHNLKTLCAIAQSAADHGLDFTLGIWEQNARPHEPPMTRGLTRENIGPYSAAALSAVLRACPAIRAVQVRTNAESGIPADQQIAFYRDHLFPAIKAAGRTLDLRAWQAAGGMLDAVRGLGVPTRVSAKYWAEFLGRPYQPAETFPGYSYGDILDKPRFADVLWEVWALGSHRVLLWGDPQFVRRAAPTFRLSGSVGFEIDAPLAQKGYGNRTGTWDIFTASQRSRVFWTREFERYWLFYQLWGRLTYDPTSGDDVWMDDMRRRFGSAASHVAEAYRQSSRVLHEVVAAHLADPNMYVWPEINPGGLIDAYKDVPPSDWRYVASIPETVNNMLTGTASAKQDAIDTANLLTDIAAAIDAAVARASALLPVSHREWAGSRTDFEVLAGLARYHAHKQRAALNLAWFDATADGAALAVATRELTAGLVEWQRLVGLTDGIYSPEMAFGPDDVGSWKDKLPYVQHDVAVVREREEIFTRFGRFDAGFDFGADVPDTPGGAAWHDTTYMRANNVAPRFKAVAPDMQYDERLGYGWLSSAAAGHRRASAVPLTPELEVRSVSRRPSTLPRDVLFRDFIRGDGEQVFQVRVPAAMYRVTFLSPDRGARTQMLAADDGLLRIRFPRGAWTVSGLIVQRRDAAAPPPVLSIPAKMPRPVMTHTPPTVATAGRPLTVSLGIDRSAYASIRLHYRAVNQNERFQTLDGGPSFTIPGAQISARSDLMYYFEVIDRQKSGWFYPDPATTTPYIVVPTRP
jgi:hypothetical protein